MATAGVMTVGGLYYVVTQDLGHGPGHDEDHHAEAHETHGKNEGQDDDGDDDDSKEESSDEGGKDKSQGGPKDEAKTKTKNPPPEERDTEQAEDPSKPGTGKPDKKKADDPSGDAPKNDENDKADPAKSDKVRSYTQLHSSIYTDCGSPTPAVSPRAPTRPLASRKASQTPTPTTARKSPSRMTRARRVRVLLRLPSSRAPSQPTVPELRTRRSEARPSRTRTKKPNVLLATSNLRVFYSTLAATVNSAARCIVCESNFLTSERQFLIPSVVVQSIMLVWSKAVDVMPDLKL
jgi:hypothetical protein